MADINRMMEALRNADAAGDVESAQRIAGMIRSAQNDTSPTQQKGPQPDTRPEAGMSEGLLDSLTKGLSMGWGDELTALESAALGRRPGDGTFDVGNYEGSFGDRYNAAINAERGQQARFSEESPVASTAAEIAGAIPTAFVPALNIARGGKLASALATGSLQGGVYGAGAGDDDRLEGALTGSAMGGVAGAASVPLAAGVGNLAKNLMTGTQANNLGLSRPSYEMMNRVAGADAAVSGQGAANIRAAGPGAMAVDAGPTSASVLDMVMQRGGPGLATASRNIQGRVADSSNKFVSVLDDVLGKPIGVKAAAKDIAQRTSAGRSQAYGEAYGSAIDYASSEGMKIEDVISRVPARAVREALDNANDEMVSLGQKNLQIMADVADDGSVSFREMPNVQQLDELKKSLQKMADVAYASGNKGKGGMYNRLARDLRDAIIDAAPSYKDAVSKGFDKIEMDNGLKLGRDMLRPSVTREDVLLGLDGMSQAAKNEAKIGLRRYIDDAMARVKTAMSDPNVDARETMKGLKDLSSRDSQEKIQALLGESETARLYDVIAESEKTFNLRSSMARNSATFGRTEANRLLGDLSKEGVVNKLRKGELVDAAKEVVHSVTGMSEAEVQRLIDSHAEELAEFLTGPRGEDAATKLQMLARSTPAINEAGARGGNLARQLMRPVPVIGAGSITQSGGGDR